MRKNATQRLRKLLEVERAALLAGDLSAVTDLSDEKETLAQEIGGSNTQELAEISGALTRNGALLTAAHDGVSQVLTMLRKQQDARQTLSGYDSTGKATSISKPSHGTERRF